MRTIRLLIAYDGTNYHGWQIQPNAATIQGEIEQRLAVIHTGPVTLHGAGRTDAGVHADGMVAHFHSNKSLTGEAFRNSLNAMLPADIRILAATEEKASFHARFSARQKLYEYLIFNGPIIMPRDRLYAVHVRSPLDLDSLQACLTMLEGTHDFASFETAGSRDPSIPCERGSTRTIYRAAITDQGCQFYSLSFRGDGFLRHMVRNMVGTLLEVGLGRRSTTSFREAFLAASRSAAGSTAPAHGLTLKKIFY